MIRLQVICSAVAVFALLGCRKAENRSIVEPNPPDDASLAFNLEPVQSRDGSEQWIGVYQSQGKVARFRIEFGAAEPTGQESAPGVRVTSGEGTLIPQAGSDSTVLLADLKRTLQAKTLPRAPQTKTTVPFTYANLGDHLSQAKDGGFSANLPGNWTTRKLFFGEGKSESQVFLNINAATKKGQFSIKDPDYGDLLLAELAKAL
jgi:hypothetical protein